MVKKRKEARFYSAANLALNEVFGGCWLRVLRASLFCTFAKKTIYISRRQALDVTIETPLFYCIQGVHLLPHLAKSP